MNLSEKEFSFSLTESRGTMKLNIFKDDNQSKSQLSIKFIMAPLTISGGPFKYLMEEITVDLFDPEFNLEFSEEWVFEYWWRDPKPYETNF